MDSSLICQLWKCPASSIAILPFMITFCVCRTEREEFKAEKIGVGIVGTLKPGINRNGSYALHHHLLYDCRCYGTRRRGATEDLDQENLNLICLRSGRCRWSTKEYLHACSGARGRKLYPIRRVSAWIDYLRTPFSPTVRDCFRRKSRNKVRRQGRFVRRFD